MFRPKLTLHEPFCDAIEEDPYATTNTYPEDVIRRDTEFALHIIQLQDESSTPTVKEALAGPNAAAWQAGIQTDALPIKAKIVFKRKEDPTPHTIEKRHLRIPHNAYDDISTSHELPEP